ncbi:hypothetical protein PoB_000826100 [Plakobranchus ocellatus]|uniref:Uncharacterized protein n=1 Tax=Plakobranchus ocellatus TaxID=259542 RepID=A0AAV3Y3C7_9GAST|nr:hypothetical protein PoB_000826100 [Plakobranchus ocellatus]
MTSDMCHTRGQEDLKKKMKVRVYLCRGGKILRKKEGGHAQLKAQGRPRVQPTIARTHADTRRQSRLAVSLPDSQTPSDREQQASKQGGTAFRRVRAAGLMPLRPSGCRRPSLLEFYFPFLLLSLSLPPYSAGSPISSTASDSINIRFDFVAWRAAGVRYRGCFALDHHHYCYYHCLVALAWLPSLSPSLPFLQAC